MSEVAIVGAVAVGSILLAWLLSLRYHNESRQIESAVRIPFNLAWILSGFFVLLGGYYKTGAALLILWGYFFFSNARRVREGEIDASPGGWRKRAGNWNPYNRSD
ncbi:hypothetical protein [Natrinema versiforme]|uniref:Uncharacterized protein n=1 Tax=Natrinema versiforme JCM 10478 TaxID=1227496 RepID=L9Y527_9EURY|nr:hypothetical protein [Natrinema versiforme]ELY68827.1 hypothetical protein C489_05658 [Natrinema versiforme JCM 10478]